MDSAQEFFFVDGAGSQCGPVTATTLKEYWTGGYVNDTTYAFAVDGSTANWTPIAQLPELLAFCTSAAPPPPPIPPVPPPLPTAASTTPPPADDGNNALLAGIRNFKKEGSLRSVKADESPPAASGGASSGDLMAQIAGGVKLRSAKESSERVPAPAPAAGMGGMMAQIAGGVKLRKTSTKVREEVGGVVDTPAAASDAARGGALRKASTRAAAATPPAEADEWAEAAPSPPPMPAPTPKVAAEDVEIKSLTSWRTRTTAEGATYYHNEDTQEVCWEKPDELKTAAERSAEGAYNWLPSETEGFEAYRVVQAPATDGSFIGESTGADGKVNRRRVSAKEAKRACALTPSHLERAPPHDLVMLPAVNEPMILHALRQRFLNDEIYTAVGSILVSVNPFKPLPLYTPSVVHKYSHRGSTELPPHVYALADNAYRGILFDGKDQSLIVSGESGAGKTEATKLSLAYLAAVAGSASGVEQKVLLANPILEAFGNAKTVRNNNSSRFGKLIDVNFDHDSRISSSLIHNYLLEKSRLVAQAPDERNFHYFYQLCAGADDEEYARLSLGPPSSFALLASSGCVDIDGVDDGEELMATRNALAQLAFTAEEVRLTAEVAAAVLHLGQLEFRRLRGSIGEGDKYSESCRIADDGPLLLAAGLLGVDAEAMQKCIVCRSMNIKGGGDVSIEEIPLSADKAASSRDALAKLLYAKLFDWLVGRINAALTADAGGAAAAAKICILDIFGFEIFEHNSFEQLLINFANEKLQQHFNLHVFKMEEELYEDEGIDYGKVGFVDNSPVLSLLERKAAGLLPILDEAVVMPGGSDATFYRKLAAAHGTSPLLTMLSKGDEGERLAFEVSHYAGIVMYDAAGFCDKNGDKVLADQRDAVLTSASPLVTALFDERPDLDRAQSSMLSPAPGAGGGSGGGGEPEFLWQKAPKGPPRVGSVFANSSSGGSSVSEASRRGSVQTPARAGAKTIAAHFSKQLASLMASLDATAPQFVRCIKPNALKTAGILQPQLVLEQLRYSGVFEATAIKKSGFPFRATHQAFVARYRCAADPEELGQYSPTRKASEADWSAEARKVLAALPNHLGDETRLRLGKTMVLWRVKEHEQLELLRNLAVEGRAGQVQTAARAFLARKLRRAAAAARAACDAAVAASDVNALTAALDLARALPTEYAWCRAAATLRARLEAERRVLAAFTELTPQDAEVVFEPLSAALAEYDGLGDEFKAAHAELHSKAKTMIDGVARRFEARAALKMIIDRAKLEHGLALAAELRMWDGRDAATAASAADQELLGMAVVALQRIIAEEKINGELRAALYGDGKLEWSGASEPALDRCSCAALQTSLAASEEFGARTADGLFLQEAARAALGVRSAVLAAGGGDWSDGARKGIDEALLACADLHAKVEELAAAAAAVAVRAQVREVSTQLGLSMQVLHHEALAMALQRATALDMGSVPEFAPTVAAAVALDAKLTEVRGGLRAGIEAVDRAALVLALDGAAELGLAHYEQPAAAHLAAEIERLLEAAAAALDTMDPSDLGAVLGEADALRLREPPIEKVRETLGLPAERFLSEQLKAAKRHGDIPREDALNTAIKDLIFERSGDAFDLAKLPRLRTADEFANAKMGGKKERREGFLRHQSKPIPTSLTQLDSKEKREEAVATFKSILGYMGDAPYQFPIMLAVELVTKALSGGAELQTEVYVQLMKQLSSNPSEASKRLGWQLLALVLQCFPPDAMVENFIEAFLRENATPDPRAYTSLMYAAVRRGPLSAAPTEEEILSMLTKDLGSSQRVSRASRAQ